MLFGVKCIVKFDISCIQCISIEHKSMCYEFKFSLRIRNKHTYQKKRSLLSTAFAAEDFTNLLNVIPFWFEINVPEWKKQSCSSSGCKRKPLFFLTLPINSVCLLWSLAPYEANVKCVHCMMHNIRL